MRRVPGEGGSWKVVKSDKTEVQPVDGSEIRGTHRLRLVVYPIIYKI